MLHVACVTEGGYVPHSAAMLHSLLANTGDLGAHVHYLHGPDLDRRDAERIREMVEGFGAAISFVFIPDSRCEGLPIAGFTGKATWYRIFLPELFPELERILFLDLDLIVTDSVLPLWETDLGDAYVAAVTNILPRDYASRLRAAGFDVQSYFNAGVLLLNLEAMRRDHCSEDMREYGVRRRDDLVLRDQDVLNAVLGGRRIELAPRWNCMNSFYVYPWAVDAFGVDALEEAKRRPSIRHFEGPGVNKPWHYLCDRESVDLYRWHRSQTPWPRFRPEGRTPKNVLRRWRSRLSR